MPFELRNQKAIMLRRTPAPNAVSPGADPFCRRLDEGIDSTEKRAGARSVGASFT